MPIDPEALIDREHAQHNAACSQFKATIISAKGDLVSAAQKADVPLAAVYIWSKEIDPEYALNSETRKMPPKAELVLPKEDLLEECYKKLGARYLETLRNQKGDFRLAAQEADIPLTMVLDWGRDLRKRYQLNVVAQAAGNKDKGSSHIADADNFARKIEQRGFTEEAVREWGQDIGGDLAQLMQRQEQVRDCLIAFWQDPEKNPPSPPSRSR